MIDVENAVYTAVRAAVLGKYPDATVAAEYVRAPASFPAVTMSQIDSSVYQRMMLPADALEQCAQITFELNIYTATPGRRKQEGKEILMVVDAALSRLGFVRILCNTVPNLHDSTIHRILARYSGVVDKTGRVYTS